jgi:hypothetical protein
MRHDFFFILVFDWHKVSKNNKRCDYVYTVTK